MPVKSSTKKQPTISDIGIQIIRSGSFPHSQVKVIVQGTLILETYGFCYLSYAGSAKQFDSATDAEIVACALERHMAAFTEATFPFVVVAEDSEISVRRKE